MRVNGNRSNFDLNLTKTNGNSGMTRVVSSSSDMVCGTPQLTKIKENTSTSKCKRNILESAEIKFPIFNTL